MPEVVLGLEIGEGDILPLVCWGDLDFSRGLPHGETGQDILLLIWISLQADKNQRTGHRCVHAYIVFLFFFDWIHA